MVADAPDDRAFRRAPAAYAVEVGDFLVVLDRATGEMHQLDPAAATIWDEVDGRTTVPQIVNRVAVALGEQPEEVAAEVHAGLWRLHGAGLLRGNPRLLPAPTPSPAPDTATPPVSPTPISPHAAVVARCLQLDLAAVEVISALRSMHVDSILLKGPILARWLYGGYGERQYGDIDLLVSPEAVSPSEELLRSRGFAPGYVSLPRTVPHHATAWYRNNDRVEIDLHDRLWGCGAEPVAQWELLIGQRERLDLIGIPVDVLGVSARLLHLCLHAAQALGGRRKKIEDLQRALGTVTSDDWSAARRLAVDLEAEDAMGAGLRLFDAGKGIADRLDLPSPRSTELVLRSSGGADGATMSILHLLRARSPTEAVRFAWGRVFPSPDYMRQWASVPTDSAAGLARAYLARSWSFLSRAARAVLTLMRAWWSTRRPRA